MNNDDLTRPAVVAAMPANRPFRLRWLEQRDAAISVQMHELARQRAKNRDEALRLRCSLTAVEAEEYDRLSLEAML